MNFLIIGTGGTGGCLGGYLAHSGNDVTFIARGRHLAAIRENGLTIHRPERGDIHITNASFCTADEYQDTPDIIFVCVKYYGLDDAISLVKRVATKDTLIIPILNVFGTGAVMQEQLPGLTCLDGCIYIWAKIEAPGIIFQPEKILRVFFGFRPEQAEEKSRLSAKAKEVEDILQAAEIHAHYTDQIQRDALQKFAFVSPMGAAGLYCHALSEDFQKEGEPRALFAGLIQEVIDLAKGMNITFERDLVAVGLDMIDHFKPGLQTSMQRDVEAGGASEFAGLVDRMVLLGKQYNVPVPLYTKISEWGKENKIQ